MAKRGRPQKYDDPYGKQKAYFETSKGKAAINRYEASDKRKENKKNWKHRQKLKALSDRRQRFIDTYGDIEAALKLLDKRECFVVIHLNGLDGNPPMTLDEIGVELFLTGSRIQQIYKDAEKKLIPLKKAIDSDADPEK